MKKLLALFVTLLLLAGCGTSQYREPPTEQQKKAVQVGMTPAEVEQVLGPATGRTESYRSGETVTGWRMEARMQGIRNAWFNVHYRDGKVVKTSESFDYLSMP
jgi:uncharacterized protein YcfL